MSLERLDEILCAEPERETEGATAAPIDRDISFEGVRFGYREGPEILKGVTFDAKAGETVAILGATGSGKSTLMLLLQRHYAPTSGAIRIGGVDIQNIRKDHLRARVGLVMQESFLYARSVRDNIRIVRPDGLVGAGIDYPLGSRGDQRTALFAQSHSSAPFRHS